MGSKDHDGFPSEENPLLLATPGGPDRAMMNAS
jgi:hypothetical protein